MSPIAGCATPLYQT